MSWFNLATLIFDYNSGSNFSWQYMSGLSYFFIQSCQFTYAPLEKNIFNIYGWRLLNVRFNKSNKSPWETMREKSMRWWFYRYVFNWYTFYSSPPFFKAGLEVLQEVLSICSSILLMSNCHFWRSSSASLKMD